MVQVEAAVWLGVPAARQSIYERLLEVSASSLPQLRQVRVWMLLPHDIINVYDVRACVSACALDVLIDR